MTNGYGGVTSSIVSLTLVAYNQTTPQVLAGGRVYLGYGGAACQVLASLDLEFQIASRSKGRGIEMSV